MKKRPASNQPATTAEAHRDDLLQAFKITGDDLLANRAGRLGPAQMQRLQRSQWTTIALDAVLIAGLAAIMAFVATKPLKPVQVVLSSLAAIALLAIGYVQLRNTQRAIKAGVVQCVSGPTRVYRAGRAGMRVHVGDRDFQLPVHFWHIANGYGYHVYFAPASKRIMAMEPA